MWTGGKGGHVNKHPQIMAKSYNSTLYDLFHLRAQPNVPNPKFVRTCPCAMNYDVTFEVVEIRSNCDPK